ncbi:MAG: helix-turn-helix domain-containing protein, partial [Actinomycetota bacterium]
KNTVQGWESGRRSLTVTRVANMVDLRHRLRRLGADPEVLDSMDQATEADYFLSYVLETDPEDIRLDDHLLATWVMKRAFAEMLGWPFTHEPPLALRQLPEVSRRGPVPPGPLLAGRERDHFFGHLRIAAETSLAPAFCARTTASLLRRQAYYLCSWTTSPESRTWLGQMDPAERRLIADRDRWSPSWMALRSLAVAQAREGDPDPLRFFIKTSINSDECHAANLNYWAYWVGEINPTYGSDHFISNGLGRWRGDTLLRRLHDRLASSELAIDIYVHTLWALLQRRAWLLEEDLASARSLCDRVEALIDTPGISDQSRRELESISLAIPLLQSFARRRGHLDA